MRDKRVEKSYFDRMLESRHELFHKEDHVEMYNSLGLDAGGYKQQSILFDTYTELFIRDVNYMYSRGDSLDSIKSARIDVALDRYRYLSQEIDANRDLIDQFYFYDGLQYPNKIHSAYTLLAWLICFNADRERIAEFADYIAPSGYDRLLDTVIESFIPNREVTLKTQCPRTFSLMNKIVDAPESERPKLCLKHLNSWGKLMATMKGLHSLGVANAMNATSNESLNSFTGDGYIGFWAWEVALVTRFFNINDSVYRDHEFYPSDLVDFKE